MCVLNEVPSEPACEVVDKLEVAEPAEVVPAEEANAGLANVMANIESQVVEVVLLSVNIV